jgi:hypothetical protein
MFGKQDMTALQLHKKALLLESELNRLALQAECERLKEAAGWLSWIKDARRQITPWALVLAPLAGVALALRLRRPASADGFLSRALRLAPSLIRLWRTWRAPSI